MLLWSIELNICVTCFTFLFVVIRLNWMGVLTLKSVVQQAIKKSCHASLLVAFHLLQVGLNPYYFYFLRREFYSGFLLLHICNDLSWVKCVFWDIFHKENNNCSRSQLVKILSPELTGWQKNVQSWILRNIGPVI